MSKVGLEIVADDVVTKYITEETLYRVDGKTHKALKAELEQELQTVIDEWLEEKKSRGPKRGIRKIVSALEKFLSVRIKSRGGYAPVDRYDVFNLYHIIDMIIAAKYEDDPDGDYPIEAVLIDKTKYMSNMWALVPHSHGIESPDEYRELLATVQQNADWANSQLNTVLKRIVQYSDITLKEQYRETK